MTEQRKPIFGFLWPKPDPDAPVDAAYHQTRRVRITPRGPVRLALLLVSTAVIVIAAGSALLVGLSGAPLGATFIAAAIVGAALLLVLRGWVVGTYVTDDEVTIETTFARTSVRWSGVASVDVVDGRRGFLGLPVRAPARESVLTLADGTELRTHIYSTSPDLWLRPEAFDMATSRLQRWLP